MLGAYTSAAFTNAAGIANIAANADVEVRFEATGALASLFSDPDGLAPILNPFQADANGQFRLHTFGTEKGYSVKVTKGAFTYTVRYQAISTSKYLDKEDLETTMRHIYYHSYFGSL